MRFLKHTSAHGTTARHDFSLTQCDPAHIPAEYAILSHRWGPDEVTYRDIENGTAQTKAGYRKLQFCAERVAHDGISYFWIDTCCIDKTSSAELSEAINSMYKWYQNATECYVYMADVSVMGHNGVSLAQTAWRSAFQSSTWFMRGWTLQELIAPTVVKFFSTEGEWLGDKSSLEQQIHDVTGVPVEALRGNISQFDVQERLSWAAHRQTTLEEDAIYCLLGLVDIHMPLIYGEGRQKALARLQREIQISSNRAAWVQSCNRSALEARPSITHSTHEGGNVSPGTSYQQSPAREVMSYEGRPSPRYSGYSSDHSQLF